MFYFWHHEQHVFISKRETDWLPYGFLRYLWWPLLSYREEMPPLFVETAVIFRLDQNSLCKQGPGNLPHLNLKGVFGLPRTPILVLKRFPHHSTCTWGIRQTYPQLLVTPIWGAQSGNSFLVIKMPSPCRPLGASWTQAAFPQLRRGVFEDLPGQEGFVIKGI